MLYLTRRPGEAVIINDSIEVRVIEVSGRSVKLGLSFPADCSVLREEVFLQVKAANEAAARSAAELETATAADLPPVADLSGKGR
jgi:carbon storage regulator